MSQGVVKHVHNSKDGDRLNPDELKKQIGSYIAEHRQAKGFDLQKVADELKIRKYFLECIEQGQFENLPGNVYTIGFIRSYTKYLGLNDQEIVDAFVQTQRFVPSDLPYNSYNIQNQKNFFSPWIIAVSLICTAILLGYFLATSMKQDKIVQNIINQSRSEINKTDQKILISRSSIPNFSEASHQSRQNDHFYIAVTSPTWIKITHNDGSILAASMLNVGKVFDITNYDKKRLTAGNIQALEFFIGSTPILNVIPAKEMNHKILENFPIDIAHFQELAKKSSMDPQGKTLAPIKQDKTITTKPISSSTETNDEEND